ncbi:hypothetical protein KXS11_11525 [Plantibacter flavus]|uniref:hypothetical protein n=1 Tax=Plantibacter flavus TaxID=150123 RepID=UPI003F189920
MHEIGGFPDRFGRLRGVRRSVRLRGIQSRWDDRRLPTQGCRGERSMADEVDGELDVLAVRVERWHAFALGLAGESATITDAPLDTERPLTVIDVKPVDPRGAPLSLLIEPRGMVLHLGEHGCRWELDDAEADTAFAERVIDAAIAGRAEELVGTVRFAVRVTFPDGTVEESTRIDGFFAPTRRWRLRGTWTRFAPYTEGVR